MGSELKCVSGLQDIGKCITCCEWLDSQNIYLPKLCFLIPISDYPETFQADTMSWKGNSYLFHLHDQNPQKQARPKARQ